MYASLSIEIKSSIGSIKVYSLVITHPFVSVTITEYVPAVREFWSSLLIERPDPSNVDQTYV